MVKEKRVKKPYEPGDMTFGKFLAWVIRDVPRVIQVVVSGFIVIYATSALGMDALLVGTILMVSKIFDGVTDLIAGYIVDNTKTKMGKGRPYEFFMLGLWVCTWLCFAVPPQFSNTMKCVWLFVAYTFANSICATFINANATAYMVRAFRKQEDYVKLTSFGGIITIGGVIIFNVVFPMLTAKVMYEPAGWSKLLFILAIPMSILGMMRFIFVKEEVDVDAAVGSDRVKLSDILKVLKTNKYIWIVSLVTLCGALFSGLGALNYLCIVTFGDTSMAGVLSIFNILAMITMVFYPMLLKKMTIKQLICFTLLFNIPGGICYYIAGTSVPLLAVAGVCCGIASLPLNYMSGLLVIDCAMYNEYKGLGRMEGTLGAVNGFANKIGGALASFIAGAILSLGGYVGTAGANQTPGAVAMVKFLAGGMPVVMTVVLIIAFMFYNLDKHKAEYEAVVMERREAVKSANQQVVEE